LLEPAAFPAMKKGPLADERAFLVEI